MCCVVLSAVYLGIRKIQHWARHLTAIGQSAVFDAIVEHDRIALTALQRHRGSGHIEVVEYMAARLSHRRRSTDIHKHTHTYTARTRKLAGRRCDRAERSSPLFGGLGAELTHKLRGTRHLVDRHQLHRDGTEEAVYLVSGQRLSGLQQWTS